jgi:polysaccharide export outer membrane protein
MKATVNAVLSNQVGAQVKVNPVTIPIKSFYTAIGVLVAVFGVLSASPSTAQTRVAQTPTAPDSNYPETDTTDDPIEIPVEVQGSEIPAEAEVVPLTEPPGEGSIQVPPIVPIPPRVTPTDPLAPLPGQLQESTLPGEAAYILGPGDQIVLDVFNVPEFSAGNGTYTILVDGSVVLPWIGRVQLQGLTLEQAAALLEREYVSGGYLVDLGSPSGLITVNLLTPRTLRVSIVGEVRRPGSYAINPVEAASSSALLADGSIAQNTTVTQWPTVTQAIQSAGGITQLADLRNVQIRRPGVEEPIDINLWELIRNGQLNEDITIRDGDTLLIPTATTLSPDEAVLVGSASFAPGTIRINVVGEVISPGTIEVPPNTSLNQAIQAAGGFDRQRARTSRVDLVRLNANGTAVRRRVDTDLAAGINEETNPALRDGDIVIIGRSGITSVADTVSSFLAPIDGILDTLDIFGIFD